MQARGAPSSEEPHFALHCQLESTLHFHSAMVPANYGATSALCIAETQGKSGISGDILVYLSLLFCPRVSIHFVDNIAGAFAIT